MIHVDTEFKPMGDTFKDIDIKINYEIAQGHVPETENVIRTTKEKPEPYIIEFHITLPQK